MNRTSKSFILGLLQFMLLLILAGCIGGAGQKAIEKAPTSVIVTSPAPRKIARTVRFSGTLKGSHEVMVYPPLPGKFIGYTRDEGSWVSKGTTVAQIDRDIPGIQYEPVPVEAPISGKFFTMGTSPGEMVAPQMPIGRISETSRLQLEFNVAEKYLNSVREGSQAEVYVPALEYSTTATLTRVSRFIDARTGGGQVEASISNTQGALAPGMHAEANVVVASKNAGLALPVDCVLGLDEKFVYVVTDRKTVPDTSFVTREVESRRPRVDTLIQMIDVGVAKKRDVEVGLDDGEFIEILSGVEPADEVIYVGQRIVEEGGTVQITRTYVPPQE